jgi:predicted metal-binding membrane protein
MPSPALATAGRGRLLARPRLMAVLCIAVLAAAGWIALGLMVAEHAGLAGDLGPGMQILDLWRSDLARALLEALCRPEFGGAQSGTGAELALAAVMWCAMALAMMMPTAAPMILTYAEIAETGAAKGEAVPSPMWLAGGYLAVWLGFALAAALLQFAATRAALLNASMTAASGLFSGAVFIAAGAYQFSALKHACVTLCQRPFPFFFANWTTRHTGVFRLGLRQGIYCLGCCWAMMLVMFAVGVMNVVWMAALGVVMTIEKVTTSTRFSRAVGGIFLLIGLAFIVSAVAANWPARAGQPS